MKIRTGFVSNSSSSSFVVICNPIKFKNIDPDDLNKINAIGDYLENGIDYFKITKDIYNQIKNVGNENLFYKLSYVKSYVEGDDEIVIKKDDLPEEFSIKPFDLDCHFTRSTEKFYERYVLG